MPRPRHWISPRCTAANGLPSTKQEMRSVPPDIEHSRTKTKHPQTNGICERFNKTLLTEFYRVAFRKRFYGSLEGLQMDLDRFVEEYNTQRPHQGRWCYGKTPMQTFRDSLALAQEKQIA